MLIDYKNQQPDPEAADDDPQLMPRLWSAYQQRLQRLVTDLPPLDERFFVAAYVGEEAFPRFVVTVSVVPKTLSRHCSVEALAWEPYSPRTSEERLRDMIQLMDWLSEEMDCDPFFYEFPESPNREVTLWSPWM
jgi:hypothetical protein